MRCTAFPSGKSAAVLLLSLLAFFMASVASTEASALVAKPLIDMTLGFGGDNLKTEGLSSNTNCFAGNQIGLAVGGWLELSHTSPEVFELQSTIGILWGSGGDGQKSTLEFAHYPVELISFYHDLRRNFRLGYGLSYQFGNRLSGEGVDQNVASTFDNALGLILGADWFGAGGIGAGVRYNNIRYHSQRTDRTYLGESYLVSLLFTFSDAGNDVGP
jgi:hypothetical protein